MMATDDELRRHIEECPDSISAAHVRVRLATRELGRAIANTTEGKTVTRALKWTADFLSHHL